MRMTAILAFGVSILASSGAFAQASPLGSERPGLPALEFTLSDETLQAEYLRDARPVNIERGELSAGVFLSEERDIVGRNVIPDHWTFQIVEAYDDTYWAALRSLEQSARDRLTGGRRHLAEAMLKEQRRTRGHPDHTAR